MDCLIRQQVKLHLHGANGIERCQTDPIQSATYQAILPYTQSQQIAMFEFFLQAAQQHGNMRGRELLLATSFQGMLFTYGSLVFQGEFEINQQQINQAVHQFMHGIFS